MEYLRRMARPVEFAIREEHKNVALVRNLGAFLARCAGDGLAVAAYRMIHPDLRRLQGLAAGYDDLPATARRERLEAVRDLLARMSRRDAARDQLAAPSAAAPVSPWGVDLAEPVAALPGIGVRRAALLGKLGIERVEDLLWRLPWRYVDRSSATPLGELRVGQDTTVCAEIRSIEEVVTSRRRMRILEVVVGDATGVLTVKWFNQPYLRARLAPGQVLMCSGRIKASRSLSLMEMDGPQFEILESEGDASLHTGRVVPVYHETRGLNSRALRGLVDQVLTHGRGVEQDALPDSLRERHGLMPKQAAWRAVHFPPPDADLAQWNVGVSPAHRRLVFEELLLLELGLAVRRRETAADAEGIAFCCDPDRLAALWRALPYAPTGAQRRVVDEVLRDMASSKPMNRLIQGDVGCGKTVVAAAAVWMAAGDGYQAAFMAPTELLAEQHGRQLATLLGGLGLRIALLTSDLARRERAELLARLADGAIDCVVGTHALLQPDVRFARFGFAVIDEQHKFGVMQRSHLVRKGYHPDVLIMTATPIPRTLAMTVYGDLDVSVIDEMPAGRAPIETRWHRESQRAAADDAVGRAIRAGRQVYVVAPRIDESDEGDVRSVGVVADHLRARHPDARIGVLHGRMPKADKDRVMRAFLSRELDVLAATTVVEVGIDVPNATVIVIEHADRYGLAQLHQLRGRVGRGREASVCLLLSPSRISDEARARLETMTSVRDGFVIADRDLAARGPGEFLGTRQSGLPDLKVANLIRDAQLVELARREAFALFERDPTLSAPEHRVLKAALKRTWGRRLALASVG
ncbi:MAG: ATP-dependent DNA helicase RecG [Nitrospirota bacterium]